MSHCAIQQSSFAAREEIWASAAVGRSIDKRETVVCPKPRRLGLVHSTVDPSYARPLRWRMSHQLEDCDSKAGNELLDMILAKGNCVLDQSLPHLASSPPFFCGSPPSRVSNPLIQDARFGDEEYSSVSPRAVIPIASGPAPSPSSAHKGGCVRANFSNNPAVRVEGFDCSIPALA